MWKSPSWDNTCPASQEIPNEARILINFFFDKNFTIGPLREPDESI
jgi:hypothetical protein